MQSMARGVNAYVAVLAVTASAILVFAMPARGQIDLTAVLVISALFALLESKVFRFRIGVGLGMGFPVALASCLMGGPWAAAVTGASCLFVLRRVPPVKRVYNASQYAIAGFCAGTVFVLLQGHPGVLGASQFPRVLLPVAAAAIVFSVVNAVLLSIVLSLAEDVSVKQVLMGTLVKSIPASLGYGLFGLLMAVLWRGVNVGTLAALLVLVPLLVARWAFSQYGAEQDAYEATISTLVQAVETKDHYTRGHSERVSRASVMIARVLGMREDRISALRYAGILHDVGKLGVPTKLLQKTGRLSEAEYEVIKGHPLRGIEMLSNIDFLDEAVAGVLHHHERVDGLGYPMGLTGPQIPEFARVIAVADAFDSMTSTRSYRGARSVPEAVEELLRCKNTQFDPQMVDALIEALGRTQWLPSDLPVDLGLDAVLSEIDAAARDHDDPTFSVSSSEEIA